MIKKLLAIVLAGSSTALLVLPALARHGHKFSLGGFPFGGGCGGIPFGCGLGGIPFGCGLGGFPGGFTSAITSTTVTTTVTQAFSAVSSPFGW